MGQEREKLGHGIRWLSEHTPDANVQQEHLRALRGAVAARPAVSPEATSPGRPAWQRRVAAGTAWGMIAVPSTAFAAEGSAPGDLLYPVKRAVEPVRAVFDPDVRARHRVDEVARLIDREAEADRLKRALEAAREALGEDDADLREQLDELERSSRPVVVTVEDDEPDDQPTTSPSRRPTTQTTEGEDSADDEPRARPSASEPRDEDSPQDDASDDEPATKPSASEPDDEDTPDEPDDEDPADEPDEPDDEDTPDEPGEPDDE